MDAIGEERARMVCNVVGESVPIFLVPISATKITVSLPTRAGAKGRAEVLVKCGNPKNAWAIPGVILKIPPWILIISSRIGDRLAIGWGKLGRVLISLTTLLSLFFRVRAIETGQTVPNLCQTVPQTDNFLLVQLPVKAIPFPPLGPAAGISELLR